MVALSLLLIDLDNLFSVKVRRQFNPLLHSRPYSTFGHISVSIGRSTNLDTLRNWRNA